MAAARIWEKVGAWGECEPAANFHVLRLTRWLRVRLVRLLCGRLALQVADSLLAAAAEGR